MTGAFSWLSSLIETFSKVIPRLVHVLKTHEAVCFRRGAAARLKPGMHIYWPVWSAVQEFPIKRQTLNLWTQTLLTKDARTVVAAATVVFEIEDILKALVETYDLQDTIGDMAQSGVKEIIEGKTLLESQVNPGEVDKMLTRAIRSELRPFGIRVVRAFLTDFATAVVVRNVSDGNRRSD